MRTGAGLVFCLFFSTLLNGQPATAKPPNPPDDRFKTDILVIVAHPDDESLIFPYLARAIYDERKTVAVVFTTNGAGGGNDVGSERATSLGAVREIEARRALSSFGIHNVWFLFSNNKDVATQNVLATLGSWDHGGSVAEVVRLIRLTRPEVILTWLPAVVAGENHGGHQAAGVIVTEAFDLAGDPTAFPAQIAFPMHLYEKYLEGLRPWQPKKLLYFSDASFANFQIGKGPQYRADEMSPSQKVPYIQFYPREFGFHESQGGRAAAEAMKKNPNQAPADYLYEDTGTADTYFMLGKSLVGTEATADIFAGISAGRAPFSPHRGFVPQSSPVLQTGGPWAFYRDFWRAHDLEHLASLLAAELEVSAGTPFHIPLLISNDSGSAQEISLSVTLPERWEEQSGSGKYSVGARDQQTALSILDAPPVEKPEWREVRYQALSEGKVVGSVTVRIHLVPHKGVQTFEQ